MLSTAIQLTAVTNALKQND